MGNYSNIKLLFIAVAITLVATGCAGTKGSSTVLQPVDKYIELAAYEKLEIDTSAQNGAYVQDDVKERIAGLIKAKIWEADLKQFKDVCVQCKNDSGLKLEVVFTRYEKGSAGARFFLAGLGQIHIDAIVSLVDKITGKVLAKTEATKTFAWGGIYGGATSIEDVEPAFAEAVVEILKQNGEKKEEIKKVKAQGKFKGEG